MCPKGSLLAVCFMFAVFSPVVAVAESTKAAGPTVDDGSRELPVPERWVAPPPTERPLMDILEGDDVARAEKVRGIALSAGIAGLCAGTMIAASGVYGMYSAARYGPDVGAINGGIGAVLSGSLVTAVSSMVVAATRESRATARE